MMSSQPVIESYRILMDFLAEILGEHYEIVLHVNGGKDGFYIDKIINGHISHRTVNSPMTNYGLRQIENKAYLDNDYDMHYSVVTDDDRKLVGSTFFIKEDNQLLGMLCINTDRYRARDLMNNLLDLIPGGQNVVCEFRPYDGKSEENEVEVLTSDITDIIHRTVRDVEANMTHSGVFKKNDKMTLIRELKRKGIFQIKGAIPKVASTLNISDPSVYRYLSEIKREEQRQIDEH